MATLAAQTANLAGEPAEGSRLAHLQWQIRTHGAKLRFVPDLEAEYLLDRAGGCAMQARGGMLLALMMLGSFLGLDTFVLGQHYSPELLRVYFVGIVPLMLLTLALTYWQPLRRHAVNLICGVMVVAGLCMAWTNPQVVITSDRPAYGFEALILYVVFVYFFSGAMFHQALAIALGMSACFVIAVLSSAVSPAVAIYCIYFIVAINLLSALGRYMLDKTYRRNYLTRMLALELAERDPLTGVYNRRAYEARLDLVLRQAGRDEKPLAVLALDIDHFKRINDAGGHPLGDELLKIVGQALTVSARRPLDCVARLGGDEFSVVWFGLSAVNVQTRLAEVQQHFDANIGAIEARCGIRPTLSIGVAVAMGARQQRFNTEQLQHEADDALYRAKENGRNQTVVQALTDPPATILRSA